VHWLCGAFQKCLQEANLCITSKFLGCLNAFLDIMTIHDRLSQLYGAIIKPVHSFVREDHQHTDEAPTFPQVQPKDLKSASKTWRNKSSQKDLSARYLDENYILKLLHNTTIPEYDSGARPCCHSKCSFKCQHKFKFDAELLRAEMQMWWGPNSSHKQRAGLFYDDLKEWCIKNTSGHYELRWFVCGRQVCQNFYLRARGLHYGSARTMIQQFLLDKRTSLSAALDTLLSTRTRGLKSRMRDEFVVWLHVFAKNVGDKLPDENMTVLPYKNLFSIYEEYRNDLQTAGEQAYGKPCSKAHFYRLFNKEKGSMKIRLKRSTGSFVRCTVCDAYSLALRSAKTVSQRARIKEQRKIHLDKQRKQREKYYKHRRKAMSDEGAKTYLSIIIDGMDQKKTSCPVLPNFTKDEPPLEQRHRSEGAWNSQLPLCIG
jgi:hypothetical protein